MLLFIFISKAAVPAFSQITNASVYNYLGGVIVAIYVIMIAVITPKIGVGNAIGLIVTGQIVAAIVIDHFGLFNTTVEQLVLADLLEFF